MIFRFMKRISSRRRSYENAPPPVLATFNTPLIQLVFVNFYLGAAEGALAAAVDYVRTTTRPWVTSGVERAADDPYILERVGEFTASVEGLRGACR